MNVLLLVFNRVYFILQKVGNQSPFLGAVILVTILVSSMILSIWLGIFAFKDESLHIQSSTYFLIIFAVFILLYLFANKYKEKIICDSLDIPRLKNIYVLSLYVVALGAFIFLSNINREKVFKEQSTFIKRNKNKSLESVIRRWFEN